LLSVDSFDIFYPYANYSIRFYNNNQDVKYVWRNLPEPFIGDTWSIKIYIDQNPTSSEELQYIDVKIARDDGIQISDVFFEDGGRIRVRGATGYNRILSHSWKYNTIYTVKWSNIDYQHSTADVSINDYTLENVPLYVYQNQGPTSIGRFIITNRAYNGARSVYFTDWVE